KSVSPDQNKSKNITFYTDVTPIIVSPDTEGVVFFFTGGVILTIMPQSQRTPSNDSKNLYLRTL
ncbi:MAG: hypothetical protein ACYSOG_05015, partial [Planctomycetota bacterium]